MLFFSTLKAQPVKVSSYEFSLGIYVGQPNYWGDYNGGLLGKSYTYRNGLTPSSTFGNDINYGVSGWLPLVWGFSLRPSLEYGTLTYEMKDAQFFMNTPYQIYSLGVQYDFNFESSFRPYFAFGYDVVNFKTPMANPDPELSLHSRIFPFYQSAITTAIPITLGFNYKLSEISSLFLESTLRFTNSDNLDNFSPPNSDFGYENDVIFSYQAGIRVKIFDLVRLVFSPSKPAPLVITSPGRPLTAWKSAQPNLLPIPTNLVPETPEVKEPIAEAPPAEIVPEPVAVVTPPIPAPIAVAVPVQIPVVDETNRKFDKTDELKKIEEFRKQKEAEPLPAQKNPKTSLTWDPTIPVILTKPTDIADNMNDEGFVTSTPPEGYYVQVFATIGPLTAIRNRKESIRVLRESGLLEDPEKQVIIIKRKQFFEVRIGVFDTYENTLAVLQLMQGTYFDSFTLIYLPDNQ